MGLFSWIVDTTTNHPYLVGFSIVIGLLILWHIWSWHLSPSPAHRVLRTLDSYPGWILMGSPIELDTLTVNPDFIDYMIYEDGKHISTRRDNIRLTPDGIVTCRGLIVREAPPCRCSAQSEGAEKKLEASLDNGKTFFPLTKAVSPMIMAQPPPTQTTSTPPASGTPAQ